MPKPSIKEAYAVLGLEEVAILFHRSDVFFDKLWQGAPLELVKSTYKQVNYACLSLQ
jgi:hypothetical protein